MNYGICFKVQVLFIEIICNFSCNNNIIDCFLFDVLFLADSPVEKSGGLAYEVILKPAVIESVPVFKGTSTPSKELSQEIIEKKLKEADERRMVNSLSCCFSLINMLFIIIIIIILYDMAHLGDLKF